MKKLKKILEQRLTSHKKCCGKKGAGKIAAGTIFGAAIGSLFGLLFAPKTGKESRKELTTKMKGTFNQVKDSVADVKSKMCQTKKCKTHDCCDEANNEDNT